MFDFETVAMYIALVIVGAGLVFFLPWLKERIGAEKLKSLWRAIAIAVQAAEQIFGAGRGSDKKEYAMAYLDDIGATKNVSVEQLDTMVEAAVYELTP